MREARAQIQDMQEGLDIRLFHVLQNKKHKEIEHTQEEYLQELEWVINGK